ncbi:YfcE family phosphodiesterase [Enterococcus nangangensis]|uniref:YfcE family phosphodiesterase n=1 Tax=Enterococcus nangangensis TaxID=2559926 RepID=UPI0010F65168|nr:metallophosphoesterase [Enterococcus nangangensis]
MQFLVVSDNHGDREILVEIVAHWQGKVDGFFHCGDSELPSSDPLWRNFNGFVSGNCDFDRGYLNEAVVKMGDETIFISHGHLTNVRVDLTTLLLKAQAAKATIALFGHTHMIGCERHDGILFLNPGSIAQPRGPLAYHSYAIIEASGDNYQVQYYNRQHEVIPQLHFNFKR